MTPLTPGHKWSTIVLNRPVFSHETFQVFNMSTSGSSDSKTSYTSSGGESGSSYTSGSGGSRSSYTSDGGESKYSYSSGGDESKWSYSSATTREVSHYQPVDLQFEGNQLSNISTRRPPQADMTGMTTTRHTPRNRARSRPGRATKSVETGALPNGRTVTRRRPLSQQRTSTTTGQRNPARRRGSRLVV